MEWKSKGEGGKRQGEKNEESGKGKGEWEMRMKRKEKKCCLNLCFNMASARLVNTTDFSLRDYSKVTLQDRIHCRQNW